MQFENYLKTQKKITDRLLRKYLSGNTEIHKAMRYVVLNKGKRFRPALVLLGNKITGGNAKKAYAIAVAIELVHSYSLVHDDLPALDNDDYRRGQFTCHKRYNEAIAILTGDALLTKAFEVLSEVDGKILNKVLNIFAKAIGAEGMIHGQVLDIQTNIKKKGNLIKILKKIHFKKTAALIEASIVLGAISGNGSKKEINALSEYGKCLGLLFQIQDDILDVTGLVKKLGKSKSDVKNNKLTYVSLFGLKKSLEIEKKIIKQAEKYIIVFKENNRKILENLLHYVVKRKN